MKLEYILLGVAVLVVLYLMMNRKEHMENIIIRKVNNPCAINEELIDGMCYSRCPEGYKSSSDYRMCEKTGPTKKELTLEQKNILNNSQMYVRHFINKNNIINFDERLERFKDYTNYLLKSLNDMKTMGVEDSRIEEYIPQLKDIIENMEKELSKRNTKTR